MSFHLRGYSSDACSICQIESAQNSPQLLALQLEILGSLKQLTEMWDIIDQVYNTNIPICNYFHNHALIMKAVGAV